jgi:lysylphosphatidylglycerol synthetase-like protein (DUF2156 family)
MSVTMNVALCAGSLVAAVVFGALSDSTKGDNTRVKTVKFIVAFASLVTGMVFTFLLALIVRGGEVLEIDGTQAFFLLMAGFVPGWAGLAVRIYFRNRAASKQVNTVSQPESAT